MARKIVFIGAGSFGFTRNVVKDILTYENLEDATLALVDINKNRLEMARRCCEKIIKAGNYKAKVIASTRRRDLLKGADAVITTILAGGTDIWKHDILIPKKYGIDINVGDTRGPSGVFRALRTLPEMLNICKDIQELCPRAIFLNYTNPMAMLCHGMQRCYPELNISGLCHSVQGLAGTLAGWIGVKPDQVDSYCAGINHLSWLLQFEHKGKDLYPRLRKKILSDKKLYHIEPVRNEMFLALDYYVTESSGHNSEYNWWFRKRPDLIKKYCKTGTSWNPGEHAFILKTYLKRNKTWEKDFTDWYNMPDWDEPAKVKDILKRGKEYASSIISAWFGGDIFAFNGNVPNAGIITNLPQGCCVEVPVLASKNMLQVVKVGDLPLSCAALTSLSATNEVMAIEGSLTGNAKLVYQSIANDPLTATKLSLAEIKKMVAEMFCKNKKYLPQFKKVQL